MGILNPKSKETGASDPILTRIVEEDTVAWYRKPNLRYIYFMLFPTWSVTPSSDDACYADLLIQYGHRINFRFRLPDDQRAANCTILDNA